MVNDEICPASTVPLNELTEAQLFPIGSVGPTPMTCQLTATLLPELSSVTTSDDNPEAQLWPKPSGVTTKLTMGDGVGVGVGLGVGVGVGGGVGVGLGVGVAVGRFVGVGLGFGVDPGAGEAVGAFVAGGVVEGSAEGVEPTVGE